jgi:hypothetical protein
MVPILITVLYTHNTSAKELKHIFPLMKSVIPCIPKIKLHACKQKITIGSKGNKNLIEHVFQTFTDPVNNRKQQVYLYNS